MPHLVLSGGRRRFRLQKAGWMRLKRADQPERAGSGGQEPASRLTERAKEPRVIEIQRCARKRTLIDINHRWWPWGFLA